MNITWSNRIEDLERVGMTLQSIADSIGLAKSTVSDIKQGRTREPGGMAAVRLFKLHQRKCKPSQLARVG